MLLGLTAVATVASPIALASSANAAVTVNDGVGTVGKGDVQSTLGWNNPAFDQNVEPAANGKDVKFARTMTRTTDNVWHCTGIADTQHSYRVTVMDQKVNATKVLNANGKQVTGWNLTGAASGPHTVVSDTGSNPPGTLACPAGSSLDFSRPFALNQIGVAKYTSYSYGDLTVNGVALPNTPALAPVA
jgi:hypothetical protein